MAAMLGEFGGEVAEYPELVKIGVVVGAGAAVRAVLFGKFVPGGNTTGV